MIRSGLSGGESKSILIGRRMFLLTAAKAIVVFGIVGRLISLQINESKKCDSDTSLMVNCIKFFQYNI